MSEIQAVAQAKCTGCNNSQFDVENRVFDVDRGVTRTLTCECGVIGAVRIGPDGLSHSMTLNYEDASWESDSE